MATSTPLMLAIAAALFLSVVIAVALVTGMRRLAKWIFVAFLFLLVIGSAFLGSTITGFFSGN